MIPRTIDFLSYMSKIVTPLNVSGLTRLDEDTSGDPAKAVLNSA